MRFNVCLRSSLLALSIVAVGQVPGALGQSAPPPPKRPSADQVHQCGECLRKARTPSATAISDAAIETAVATLAGAATGGGVGSVLPGAGTVAGTAVGGAIGGGTVLVTKAAEGLRNVLSGGIECSDPGMACAPIHQYESDAEAWGQMVEHLISNVRKETTCFITASSASERSRIAARAGLRCTPDYPRYQKYIAVVNGLNRPVSHKCEPEQCGRGGGTPCDSNIKCP
jgi:hypothetical protein